MAEPINESQFAPCLKRTRVTKIDNDGSQEFVYRCTHQGCTSFASNVTPDECACCPLRVPVAARPPNYNVQSPVERDFEQPTIDASGVITYKKTGWEPPVAPEGYQPKSKDAKSPDAWVLLPQWPKCPHRQQVNSVRPCGCISVNQTCTSDESGWKGKWLKLKACQDCPIWKKLAEESAAA